MEAKLKHLKEQIQHSSGEEKLEVYVELIDIMCNNYLVGVEDTIAKALDLAEDLKAYETKIYLYFRLASSHYSEQRKSLERGCYQQAIDLSKKMEIKKSIQRLCA